MILGLKIDELIIDYLTWECMNQQELVARDKIELMSTYLFKLRRLPIDWYRIHHKNALRFESVIDNADKLKLSIVAPKCTIA